MIRLYEKTRCCATWGRDCSVTSMFIIAVNATQLRLQSHMSTKGWKFRILSAWQDRSFCVTRGNAQLERRTFRVFSRWTCPFKFVADVHFRDVITQGKRARIHLIYFHFRREKALFLRLFVNTRTFQWDVVGIFFLSFLLSSNMIVVLIPRDRIGITDLNCKNATKYIRYIHIYI